MNYKPLLKRSLAALAEIAVDELHNLTVTHLQQMNENTQDILDEKPQQPITTANSSESLASTESDTHSYACTTSLVAVALIGLGVAICFWDKRSSDAEE